MLNLNQVLTPSLTFTTPGGKTATVFGLEKDLTVAPVWRGKVECFGWIVNAKLEGEQVDIKFAQDGRYSGIKYGWEVQSKYRNKL